MKISADSLDNLITEANTQFVGIQYTKEDVYINHTSKGVPIAKSKKLVITGEGDFYDTDYPDVSLQDPIQIVLKKELNGLTYSVLSVPTNARCDKPHAV